MERSSSIKNKFEKSIDYKELYQCQKSLRISLEKQLDIQKIKLKKLLHGKIKGKLCPQCLKEQEDKKNKDLFIDPYGFSKKIQTFLDKKKIVSIDTIPEYPNQSKECPIIENFAVFGVPQNSITCGEPKSLEDLQGQILYSAHQPSDVQNQASRFLFPSGMAVKKLTGQKAREKAMQMMSFCYTNLKSFILSFECPQDKFESQQYHTNPLLNYVNPEKKLFCICIGIYDYSWIKQKNSSQKLNTSLSINDYIKSGEIVQSKVNSAENTSQHKQGSNQQSQSIKSTQQKQISIGVSQRVFCILSYYPFFTFFEDIIRNLINIVKMERLTIYKHKDQDIKNTDSLFQLERIKELYRYCLKNLQSKKIQYNRHFQLKLINGQKLTLMTDQNLAKTYFVDEWIFSILNMFTVQTFLDLFTLLMLEDRLVFICQNSHILTYTIYLFANLLPKPFKYAFPVVNIIPNEEEFLNAPFPVVYGMLKKRKYIEEKRIVEKYANTYVFLSPDKVDLVFTESKKSILKRRPNRLKNDINNLFKELKKQRKNQHKTSKYQLQANQYCILSSIEQRQLSIQIIQKVKQYVIEELVNYLPTHQRIAEMKNNIDQNELPKDKDQHSYLMQIISNDLKKVNTDPFFQKFLDTQMINVYLFQ